jgi:predicted transcriptional regulator of viral defense system
MPTSIKGLSSEEAELLMTLAADGRTIFTIAEAYEHWAGDPRIGERLQRLVDKGWLERIERGKYIIIPLEAGPEREWSEDALLLSMYLVEPAAVAYWSALNYWNLTEQVPRVTYIQTTSRKRKRQIEALGMRFQIVTVVERKFFGLHRAFVDHNRIHITDREKTLLDGLDRPDLSGGIKEVAGALRTSAATLDWNRLDEYLELFGSGAVVKRLGFLVEATNLEVPRREERLLAWSQRISSGISRLDPSSAREPHRIVTRWGLGINVDEDGLREGE